MFSRKTTGKKCVESTAIDVINIKHAKECRELLARLVFVENKISRIEHELVDVRNKVNEEI